MKTHERPTSQAVISPRRKKLFGIIIFSIPVVFLVVLEFSLRQIHYGPDLSLFSVDTIGGRASYTLNPAVKNRYFNNVEFNSGASPEHFLVTKRPGTFRMFCLGGSTTVGYPYWYNGAFSTFLRDRLRALFPDRYVEIVNVGMTATNSFTVLDLTADLVKYDPDLLIVYDGHNEFYGALGAASNETGGATRWMTMLYLRMIHLRTYQLMKNLVLGARNLFGAPPSDFSRRTTLMDQVARGKNVPAGSDVYVRGLSIFKQNMEAVIHICHDHNIPVFFSTQASNIRTQYPFISNNSAGISEQHRSSFQELFKRGEEFQAHGVIDSALVLFQSAIALDTPYAAAHFRLAQCFEAEKRMRDAYSEYIRARDDDELRFRTDSRFNDLIRSIADGKQCFVADIEAVFKAHSPDSLIGNELILEHLHPNAWGHFLIAKEYARLMHIHGLLASPQEWAKRDTMNDALLWSRRPLTEVDELLALRKTKLLVSGWPFKSPPADIPPVSENDTLRFIVEEAVRNQIGWETAHGRAAEYYKHHGMFAAAAKEYETIVNQFPLDVTSYLALAQLLFEQKKLPQAEMVFRASLQVQQTPFAYRALGDICMKLGRMGDAVHYYTELSRFPDDPSTAPENAYMLALAYLFSGETPQAVTLLEQTVHRYPWYKPANELLSKARSVNGAPQQH